MNRIDEDLIKRQVPEIRLRLNDDVLIEQSSEDYLVKVWCDGAFVWITFEVFSNLEEAMAWASIPENVA